MSKETDFLVDICKENARLGAKLEQATIDLQLKQLLKQERKIKREIEELQRRFNKLGQDHCLPVYPFGPMC